MNRGALSRICVFRRVFRSPKHFDGFSYTAIPSIKFSHMCIYIYIAFIYISLSVWLSKWHQKKQLGKNVLFEDPVCKVPWTFDTQSIMMKNQLLEKQCLYIQVFILSTPRSLWEKNWQPRKLKVIYTPEKLVNIPSIEWKIIVQNLQKPWFGLFLRPFWGLHPGRLTAGTYKSPMKIKENDLNQTSMIMFHVNVQGGINLNNTFWMRPRWSSKALRWCLCFRYAIRCYQLASFLWKEPTFF